MSPSSDDSSDSIINYRDEHGKTPLQVAIEKERLNVVQQILQLSPKLDLIDDEENNIIHIAARTTRDIIAAVCNSISNRSMQVLPNEASNLDVSNENKMDQPASLIKLLNTKNRNNFTPLYLACFNDKTDCVKELLKVRLLNKTTSSQDLVCI